MSLFELQAMLITTLVAALLAASLSMQGGPADRDLFDPTAVCEKPGLSALGLVLTLH